MKNLVSKESTVEQCVGQVKNSSYIHSKARLEKKNDR